MRTSKVQPGGQGGAVGEEVHDRDPVLAAAVHERVVQHDQQGGEEQRFRAQPLAVLVDRRRADAERAGPEAERADVCELDDLQVPVGEEDVQVPGAPREPGALPGVYEAVEELSPGHPEAAAQLPEERKRDHPELAVRDRDPPQPHQGARAALPDVREEGRADAGAAELLPAHEAGLPARHGDGQAKHGARHLLLAM